MAAGCGIPQISFLAAPELGTVNALLSAVSFAHDPTNDVDGFRGYEIYYKFYGSADAQAEFATDRSRIEAAGPQSAPAVLEQRGFYRVFASGRNTSPAIEISPSERGVAFDVNVQFQFTTTEQPARATWNATGPETEELVRDQEALGLPVVELGFSADDIEPDAHADLPNSSQVDPPAIAMAITILSYGIDFDVFSPIYSQPVVVEQLLEIAYQ